jgi:hypothetical protein
LVRGGPPDDGAIDLGTQRNAVRFA